MSGPEGLPTREQLVALVDRTERHVLTPREAYLLRLGLADLAARAAAADAPVEDLGAQW